MSFLTSLHMGWLVCLGVFSGSNWPLVWLAWIFNAKKFHLVLRGICFKNLFWRIFNPVLKIFSPFILGVSCLKKLLLIDEVDGWFDGGGINSQRNLRASSIACGGKGLTIRGAGTGAAGGKETFIWGPAAASYSWEISIIPASFETTLSVSRSALSSWATSVRCMHVHALTGKTSRSIDRWRKVLNACRRGSKEVVTGMYVAMRCMY